MTSIDRIASLLCLADGWCDGEGSAVDPGAAQAASELLLARPAWIESARPYPTYEGGVKVEVDRCGWNIEIEFQGDDQVEIWGYKQGAEEDLGTIGADDDSDAVGFVSFAPREDEIEPQRFKVSEGAHLAFLDARLGA